MILPKVMERDTIKSLGHWVEISMIMQKLGFTLSILISNFNLINFFLYLRMITDKTILKVENANVNLKVNDNLEINL